MTASEFAFLALGLVLGVASGAALIEILRARPPARREVKVTVARNSIHASRAATLSDPALSTAAAEVARGGPADRRWVDRDLPPADEIAAPTSSPPGSLEPGPMRTPVPDPRPSQPSSPGFRPTTLATPRLAADGGGGAIASMPGGGTLVGIAVRSEPDPQMAALRSSAASMAAAAVPVRAGGGGTALASRPDAPMAAAAAASDAEDPTGAAGESAAGAGAPGPGPAPVADGPCAEERRIADERCAVAERARDGATQAADALRQAQRAYDDHVARSEQEAAVADPRAVRAAKEAAQRAFRAAQSGTRDTVDAAARDWLSEINRINHETREAAQRMERDRAAAAALAPSLERLAVEADAARIAAESADEACLLAREAVAACDESRTMAAAGAAAAARATVPPSAEVGEEALEEDALPMASRGVDDPVILRLLRGDREAMQRLVARLGGEDADERQRWQGALTELVEAVVARAIEAAALDFPTEHAFWGPFTRSQSRDIATGLSSLGFRFDGFGDWADDRVPSQRDLSLAVGYAGLDPFRIRHWPTDAEIRDLLRDVRVAADEYLVEAAGGLTLGELVSLLGRRADGLTELWNSWGLVRPLLLEAA